MLYVMWSWISLKWAQRNVRRKYVSVYSEFIWLVELWILTIFFILFYSYQNFEVSKYMLFYS